MSSLFCCTSIRPYWTRVLDHEPEFSDFMAWATRKADNDGEAAIVDAETPYAVQLVRQVSYGPLESKRYFIPVEWDEGTYVEVGEAQLVAAGFQKLNSCEVPSSADPACLDELEAEKRISYKNFKCAEHGRFFEVNLYEKGSC